MITEGPGDSHSRIICVPYLNMACNYAGGGVAFSILFTYLAFSHVSTVGGKILILMHIIDLILLKWQFSCIAQPIYIMFFFVCLLQ